MADNRTISEAIGDDHKAIDSYAEKIKSSNTLEEKIQWRNQFTWTLARHAVSEELTMYPAMEKHMGQEGTDLTNVDREQHQAVSVASWMSQGKADAL
jgi:hemerythrin superfamily protein